MSNIKFSALFVFLWCHLIGTLDACNACGPSNVACISETQYQVCTNGVQDGAIAQCPDGHICTVEVPLFCQPRNTSSALISCRQCGVCHPDGVFACVSRTEFALCLGGTTPTATHYTCAEGLVCNINSPNFCISESGTTLASCSAESTNIPSIDSSNLVPSTLCKILQRQIRYPLGNDLFTTCRQYLYCFLNGGVWSGQLYTCPGSTYFNSTSLLCTQKPESRCA